MITKLENLFIYDIIPAPGFSNSKIINDEDIEWKKVLKDMEKRNTILDKLLKED